MPGRGGHYAEDLAHLKDWKPAMIISMAQEAELVAEGAGNLAMDVMHSGARWISFPVADYGVGTPAQEDQWQTASKTALSALRGGGRVLVHCRGGCGRSGMAALRLMVAAGEKAQPALKRLRAVRPCAVETDAQFRWARKG